MSLAVEILGWCLLLSGSAAVLVGSIGLLRLPDFYTRIHAAGMTDTLGVWLILAGLACRAGWGLVTVKLLMLGAFCLLTSPLSSHALAKAAWLRGLRPLTGEEGDEGHG
ncbi:MAG: monovalent cation/H(+) antiporter subunit G [Planctomycetota bacterium]|jgi:multicomponent Na+:H+ antiporter subunit G|nr:monovalent cation/H(+) antiporter subunit G [Planctomycetota bacterium]MDP6762965.1 monovalent cation/H(+) antiporter subunit G [Planctomycetota bacterium]MDP6990544.1 monovalent cation/H(+) antiporter subunit G [Planctomycetota bacterium]